VAFEQDSDRLSSHSRHQFAVLRALVLRQLADGQTIRKVARKVGLTPKTVGLTSQRYQQGGLDRALYEGARPGKEALLDAQQRQRIVALVCSPPPEGRARWTVRLLAEEAVKSFAPAADRPATVRPNARLLNPAFISCDTPDSST
jgi:transposase